MIGVAGRIQEYISRLATINNICDTNCQEEDCNVCNYQWEYVEIDELLSKTRSGDFFTADVTTVRKRLLRGALLATNFWTKQCIDEDVLPSIETEEELEEYEKIVFHTK